MFVAFAAAVAACAALWVIPEQAAPGDEGEIAPALLPVLAAAVIASQNGARIIRAHDVAETVDVVKVVDALVQSETGE